MVAKNLYNKALFASDSDTLLPSVSIDCVIFGFHDGELKILLNKFDTLQKWMLPGGFVWINENVDAAAYRLLQERTGLQKIYLTQFHLFGDCDRTDIQENKEILERNNVSEGKKHWFAQRFVSVGYYALVDFTKVNIKLKEDEDVRWYSMSEIPKLYSDHNKIIEKAVSTIRLQLGYVPIGYQLLPEKFTMTELRVIYETILGQKLDRRNFQRKMLMAGLVIQLDEVSKKFGIKPTALFSFNKEKYKGYMDNDFISLF